MNRLFLRSPILPIIVSLLLHVGVIGIMLLGWESASEPKEIKRPNFVQAKLVKLDAQTKPKEPAKDKPNVVDLTQKRKEKERLEKLAEQKKQQALKQKVEEQKKAEAEKKRKEQERKANEAAEKQRQEQMRQQKEREALAQAKAVEQAQQLEASYAQTAQSYMGAIAQRIENNWSRPPSARSDMSCELLIKLVPTGRVINVDVTKSSGNSLFDRSAVQAVNKAEQFPEIKNMPSAVFERYYRELTLVFKPQDLRQ